MTITRPLYKKELAKRIQSSRGGEKANSVTTDTLRRFGIRAIVQAGKEGRLQSWDDELIVFLEKKLVSIKICKIILEHVGQE